MRLKFPDKSTIMNGTWITDIEKDTFEIVRGKRANKGNTVAIHFGCFEMK